MLLTNTNTQHAFFLNQSIKASKTKEGTGDQLTYLFPKDIIKYSNAENYQQITFKTTTTTTLW